MKTFLSKEDIISGLKNEGTIYSYREQRGNHEVRVWELCDDNDDFVGWVHHQTLIAFKNNSIIDENYKLLTINNHGRRITS